VFVFDTSAFINGRKFHFLPTIVPSIWKQIEDAIDDGRVIVPREVFRELTVIDDDTAAFIRRHAGAVVEPSELVQRRAGELAAEFSTRAFGMRQTPSFWPKPRRAASPS
jgi:hypothetical protein